MIPSSRKMKRSDFTLVKQCKREKLRGRHLLFTLFRCDRIPHEPQKFSVSISKKKVKRSVKRNRIKRQVYALVRAYLPFLENYPQYSHFSISLVSSDDRIPFTELEQDFLILKKFLSKG